LSLIIFYILPENPLHDVLGLLSLIVYALLPFYFIVRFFFRKIVIKSPSSIQKNTANTSLPNRNEKITLALLLGLLLYVSPQFLHTKMENTQAVNHLEIDSFEKTITNEGVLKFQNEEALLYVKPPVRFFQGSHDPRFCWKGSGYEFSNIELQPLNGQTIYTAVLTKETDKLYTAWWYQSDDFQTPYEWTWRWRSLSAKENFYMVSISCEDKITLEKWIENLNNDVFQFKL
jgi:exosortase N